MTGLFHFYTWYIPGIYHLSMVYIWCRLGIYHIHVHREPFTFHLCHTWYIPLICLVYVRFPSQDFVGSITVAPTLSDRIFRTMLCVLSEDMHWQKRRRLLHRDGTLRDSCESEVCYVILLDYEWNINKLLLEYSKIMSEVWEDMMKYSKIMSEIW